MRQPDTMNWCHCSPQQRQTGLTGTTMHMPVYAALPYRRTVHLSTLNSHTCMSHTTMLK